jgi:transposase
MRIADAVIQSSLPREDEMADLFWFSDEQWARIAPLLPTNTRGLKRVDDRRVLSGIVHVLRSGCPWSHCPREYGPAKTMYNRFVRWARRGIWKDIFAALAGREGNPDRLLIDSTIVRAHRSAAGGKGGPGIMLLVVASAAGPPKSTW